MKNDDKKASTKGKKNDEIRFSVAFKEDGDSFQNVMEKVLMSKIAKNV